MFEMSDEDASSTIKKDKLKTVEKKEEDILFVRLKKDGEKCQERYWLPTKKNKRGKFGKKTF